MKISSWDTNLKVRLVGETINSILFWMFFPFMMIYFMDIFGEKLAGILMMLPPILGVFASLYGGYAADRYGRKKIMLISLAVQSALLFIFAFSDSSWMDYFAFNGITIMGSIYRPASAAMVADLVPVEDRKPVFAAFYMSINLGVVLGPTIGSFFFFSYRTYLILTAAIFAFILFTVMSKVLKETLPASASNSSSELNIRKQFRNYQVIFNDKVFFIYIIAGILVTQVFMQLDLYLGAYLKNEAKEQIINFAGYEIIITGENLFGWLVSENGLLVVLFGLMISRLTQKWSDEKALIVGSILFGVSFWLMGFTTNVWLLFILMGFFTLAELIRTPVIQNFITKIAPEDKRGQYLGASSLQFSVGRTIAPLAVFLSAYFEPIVIFSLIFASSIGSAILYKYMFSLYRQEEIINEGVIEST